MSPITKNAASLKGSSSDDGGLSASTAAMGKDVLPAISVPSGGATLRSMSDSFSMSQATGIGSYTVPLQVTKGRPGAEMSLSLKYSTGGGNGPFGLGWSHSLDLCVSRKTNSTIPRYVNEDDENHDHFILSGHDELVPARREGGSGSSIADVEDVGDFRVQRFRSRVEERYTRIELWTNKSAPGDVHWKTISADNTTSIFGRDQNSRIYADSEVESARPRIFSWLLSEQFDCHGNAQSFVYKAENSDNVDTASACESHRTSESRSRMRYLKRVRYGNVIPVTAANLSQVDSHRWLFEIVYDYGEHNRLSPTTREDESWICRRDPFSSYRSGFEQRTYRLCHRILMFHHFEEELGRPDYLVASTDLKYDQGDSVTYLQAVQHIGYVVDPNASLNAGVGMSPYLRQSLPPLSFDYTRSSSPDQIKSLTPKNVVDQESFDNIPCGITESYQWLDLLGEGVPGVFTQQAGEWYYKDNRSPLSIRSKAGDVNSRAAGLDRPDLDQARLGPLTLIADHPSLRPEQASALKFVDVACDGTLDLVCHDSMLAGFYKSAALPSLVGEQVRIGWQTFQPFINFPGLDLDSSRIRYLDLTGDGLADIVVFHDHLFVWYQSLGEGGYAAAAPLHIEFLNESSPRILFSDQLESIHLADMSGDGLVDIVRIRNKDICYWPNMGYGFFGSRITMDNAPVFDADTSFNPRNVLVCDIDGSGVSDLIYHSKQEVSIFLNSAGNALQSAISLPLPISYSESVTVSAVDLFGNGTSCIVWSTNLPSLPGRTSTCFIDLNGGTKPHLLSKISNGMGGETDIRYAPSTAFYLKDKVNGNQWLTRLPYPVHCVEQIVKRDLISKSTHVQRYAYHHGAYDSDMMEFAGFALVEQWDSETLALHQPNDRSTDGPRTFELPPVHRKYWYHTGVLTSAQPLEDMLASEYYKFDGATIPQAAKFSGDVLRNTVLSGTHTMSLDEQKQSIRTLRGQPLREEVYTVDDTDRESLPHSVKAFGSAVRLLQPSQLPVRKLAVFSKYIREEIDIVYERLKDQPRVEHHIVLETDAYGNVLKNVKVNYGRMVADTGLQDIDRNIQGRTVITYEENQFTDPVLDDIAYRTPLVFSTKMYEILGYTVPDPTRLLSPSDLTDLLVQSDQNPRLEKRLVSQTETRYRQDDLTAMIDTRRLEPLGLHGCIYSLCLSSNTIDQIDPPWRSSQGTPSDTQTPSTGKHDFERRSLIDNGGYVDVFKDGRLWTQSVRHYYHSSASLYSAAELKTARASFFAVRRVVDGYNSVTLVDYDKYFISPNRVEDPLHNVTSGELDYRVLQIGTLVDENENRIALLFDALGNLSTKAFMGKLTEAVGDSLEGLSPVVTADEMDALFQNPLAVGSKLLGKASSRFFEDYRQVSTSVPSGQGAARQAYVSREIHAHEKTDSPVSVKLQYFNGFGDLVQTKQNAEPEETVPVVERWRCSQYVMLNDKGSVVEEFEPFFDHSSAFVTNRPAGPSTIYIRDSLDRKVVEILPSKAWRKTIYTPWKYEEWDANDTVLIDPLQDEYLKPFKSILSPRLTLTWYKTRIDGSLGPYEILAAQKTSLHAHTPTTNYYDSAGRVYLSVKALTREKQLTERKVYDVLGRIEQVQDQNERVVVVNRFDMLGRVIFVHSLDHGRRWMLVGASGEVMIRSDDRGYLIRSDYDSLGRLTQTWCQNKLLSIPEYLMVKTEYGETFPRAEANNLRKKVYQHYDQSGVRRSAIWDFKGRALLEERRIAKIYSGSLDWRDPTKVELEYTQYVSATRYDALDRVLSVISADDTIIRNEYLPGGLLGSMWINARNQKGTDGNLIWNRVVGDKRYDAIGRLVADIKGNGIQTLIEYDLHTRQIARQRTLRNTVSLQDYRYTRDPCGNPVYVQRESQPPSTSRFKDTSADCEYTYDSIYRLIISSGRENVGQTRGSPDVSNNESISVTLGSKDQSAMKRFTESYTYDEYGNTTTIAHEIHDSQYPGWTRTMSYAPQVISGQSVIGNRLSSAVVGTKSELHTFDIHGNPTSMPHLANMSWDHANQLRSSTTQATKAGVSEMSWYVYDSDGVRVRKVTERHQISMSASPPKISDHVYIGAYDVHQEYSDNGQLTKQCDSHHIIDDDDIVALVEFWSGPSNQTPPRLSRFQVNDPNILNSLELDEDGQEISYEEYSAFGNSLHATQVGSAPKSHGYSNKQRDRESGFYYFGRRYYVSWLGRFANPDPIGIAGGINTYQYCSANPMVFRDPDGLNPFAQAAKSFRLFMDNADMFRKTAPGEALERAGSDIAQKTIQNQLENQRKEARRKAERKRAEQSTDKRRTLLEGVGPYRLSSANGPMRMESQFPVFRSTPKLTPLITSRDLRRPSSGTRP